MWANSPLFKGSTPQERHDFVEKMEAKEEACEKKGKRINEDTGRCIKGDSVMDSVGVIKKTGGKGPIQQVIITPQQQGRADQKMGGPHMPTNKVPSFVIYNTPGPTQTPLVPPSAAYPTNYARPIPQIGRAHV